MYIVLCRNESVREHMHMTLLRAYKGSFFWKKTDRYHTNLLLDYHALPLDLFTLDFEEKKNLPLRGTLT